MSRIDRARVIFGAIPREAKIRSRPHDNRRPSAGGNSAPDALLFFLMFGWLVTTVAAWFAILFTGSYPASRTRSASG